METLRPKRQWVRDGRVTMDYTRQSVDFIKEHRLWEGFQSYTWLVKGMMIGGILLSLHVLSSWNTILYSQDAGDNASVMSFFSSISLESLSSWTEGSMKYVILIALEIVIFHFTRRSLMIATGDRIDTSFKTFIAAEKRMIQVAFFSYIAEKIFVGISNAGLSLFNLDLLQAPVGFIIASFYLGFAIVDNYNEIYKMTIKQSHRYTWHYAPVALIIGAMLNIMIQIPIFGFIIGPVFCAVIGTLAMHHISPELADMAWVYVENKRGRRKKNKKKE